MRYDQLNAITSRHARIIELIRRGTYSTPALAELLGISEQTVYRDIGYLKRNGHKIKSVRVSRGWAYQLNSSEEEAA